MKRCDRCGRPAEREIHHELGGESHTIHLCSTCFQHFLSQGGLSSWLNEMPSLLPFDAMAEPLRLFRPAGGVCPHCGTTYQSFTTTGLLGCKHCYDAFEKLLEDEVLPRLQRGPRYRGRAYGQAFRPTPRSDTEEKEILVRTALTSPEKPHNRGSVLDQLKVILQESIQAEDYERAARLRDEIRKLEASARKAEQGGDLS